MHSPLVLDFDSSGQCTTPGSICPTFLSPTRQTCDDAFHQPTADVAPLSKVDNWEVNLDRRTGGRIGPGLRT